MLIRKTKPKSHVIRELFSTLTADWYLDGPLVDAEHFIDVKPIKQFDYDKTLAYICKNRQKDVEARNDLSLEEIYTSSDYIEDYMLNHHTV